MARVQVFLLLLFPPNLLHPVKGEWFRSHWGYKTLQPSLSILRIFKGMNDQQNGSVTRPLMRYFANQNQSCVFNVHFSLFTQMSAARPQRPGTAGVFLLPEGGKYTFSFSAAAAACLQLNVTIASRAQVERALQHGLETCK